MSKNVQDLVQYFLVFKQDLTALRLHKLLYYAQAWSLVWDERPMYNNHILAWEIGPTIKEVYDLHRDRFKVTPDLFPAGNIENLTQSNKETLDEVMSYYGDRPAQWLSDLVRMEDPWKLTREQAGLKNMERGDAIISHEIMSEYYASL